MHLMDFRLLSTCYLQSPSLRDEESYADKLFVFLALSVVFAKAITLTFEGLRVEYRTLLTFLQKHKSNNMRFALSRIHICGVDLFDLNSLDRAVTQLEASCLPSPLPRSVQFVGDPVDAGNFDRTTAIRDIRSSNDPAACVAARPLASSH